MIVDTVDGTDTGNGNGTDVIWYCICIILLFIHTM